MTRAAFQRVGLFAADDMPRSVERLERNVQKKFDANDLRPAASLFDVTDIQLGNCLAKFGQLVQVDPSAGALVVAIPRADDPLADSIRIANVGTSTNAITIACPSPDITIDRASTYVMSGANAAVELYPDRVRKNWVVFGVVPAVSADVTVSPASFSGAQNDYAPTGWSGARYVRLTITGTSTITGFSAAVTVVRKTLILTGGNFTCRLMGRHTGSAAANRILTPYPNDVDLNSGWVQDIWYDATDSRWRIV